MRRAVPLPFLVLLAGGCDPCAGTVWCKNPPEVHVSGEMIVHATGAPAEGVQITFARDSGPELVADTMRAVSDARGHFLMRTASFADGTVFGSLTVTPGQSYPPFTVPNFRLKTTRVHGDGNVLGRLVVDPFMFIVGELRERYYRRLLTNGVRIWEWKGDMMHAKTSVVDGRWVRVGSTDFNALGVAFNYELDALVEDSEVGRAAEERFLNDLDLSHQVTIRSRVVRNS